MTEAENFIATGRRDMSGWAGFMTRFVGDDEPKPFDYGVDSEGSMIGVRGTSRYFGVVGESEIGDGVSGYCKEGVGVHGVSEGDFGVLGMTYSLTEAGVKGYNLMTSYEGELALAIGPGVSGSSINGPGVEGTSRKDIGVLGSSINGPGVFGISEKTVGISGFSNNSTGVQGSSRNGIGVHGESSNNYGGQFQGGQANLYLTPMSTKGAPKSGNHRRGELLVDSDGVLFFCTGSGAPGTWKRVQLV